MMITLFARKLIFNMNIKSFHGTQSIRMLSSYNNYNLVYQGCQSRIFNYTFSTYEETFRLWPSVWVRSANVFSNFFFSSFKFLLGLFWPRPAYLLTDTYFPELVISMDLNLSLEVYFPLFLEAEALLALAALIKQLYRLERACKMPLF